MAEENAYKEGWGSFIFQTATEMMHRQMTAKILMEENERVVHIASEWEKNKAIVEPIIEAKKTEFERVKNEKKSKEDKEREEKRLAAEKSLLEEEDKKRSNGIVQPRKK